MTDAATGCGRWGPPLVLVGAIVLVWEAYVRLPGSTRSPCPRRPGCSSALWDFRAAAVGHLVPTLVEALVGCALSVVARRS